MVFPLGLEIVKGNPSAAIDASLLKGVTGAVAVESVSESGGTLTIVYRDESNVRSRPLRLLEAGAAATTTQSRTQE